MSTFLNAPKTMAQRIAIKDTQRFLTHRIDGMNKQALMLETACEHPATPPEDAERYRAASADALDQAATFLAIRRHLFDL
jgi:hypothetical protein